MKNNTILLGLLLTSIFSQAESYESFIASMDKGYKNFSTKMDKDFAKALGKKWKSFDTTVKPSYHNPKPIAMPSVPKVPIKIKDNSPKVIIIVANPPLNKEPILPQISSVPQGYNRLSFSFFAQPINLVYNKQLNHSLQNFNNHSIANYWMRLSAIEKENFLGEIQSYQKSLNLNDWHLYLLIQKISNQIASSTNNSKLLSWFILNNLGYDVKLGYDSDGVYLLLNINQTVYGTSYSIINHQHYYNFEYRGHIKTYSTKFANTRPLNLAELKLPFFKKNIQTRVLSFHNQGQLYKFTIPYDKNLIDLYDGYPALNWKYYFKQPISGITKFELFKQLKQVIHNMSEIEAVNFLLHLTQYGFEYATDNQQFGRERSLFFEESLNYPYNDCEDRSIFFGKLVKELLGLDVVALHYPNHLATAVKFKSNVEGESIIYNNEKYIICDPTYIGANIGKAQPKFKGFRDVKIIPINY